MPRSKRPRKKYVTPEHNTQTHGRVPSLLRTAPARENWLKLKPHTQLDALVDGTGGTEALEILKVRVNWGWGMLVHFFDSPDGREAFVEALDALRAIEIRCRQGLGLVPTPQQAAALGVALNLTDELQRNTTRKEQAQTLVWVRDHAALDIKDFAV